VSTSPSSRHRRHRPAASNRSKKTGEHSSLFAKKSSKSSKSPTAKEVPANRSSEVQAPRWLNTPLMPSTTHLRALPQAPSFRAPRRSQVHIKMPSSPRAKSAKGASSTSGQTRQRLEVRTLRRFTEDVGTTQITPTVAPAAPNRPRSIHFPHTRTTQQSNGAATLMSAT